VPVVVLPVFPSSLFIFIYYVESTRLQPRHRHYHLKTAPTQGRGVRHHAVGIIVNEVAAPLAILMVQRLLDAQELFGAQLWERRFDFGDRAHGGMQMPNPP